MNFEAILAIASHMNAPGPRFRRAYHKKTAVWLDEQFFHLLKLLGVDSLMEVGAHGADASIRFAEAGGSSVAIEANPYIYAEKTRDSQKFGVNTVNCAVGETPTVQDLWLYSDSPTDGRSSLRKQEGVSYRGNRIAVRTIDDLRKEYLPDSQGLSLWIDVEGCSLEVLKGAQETLLDTRTKCLKVEVEANEFWEGQSLAPEVHRYLRGKGFDRFLRDMEYGNQYNVIYVRESLCPDLFELHKQAVEALMNLRLTSWERGKDLAQRLVRRAQSAVHKSE